MKKCSKCQQEKPLTDFWRNAGQKDGYQHRCKDCQRPLVKAWNARKIAAKQEPPGYKRCRGCCSLKPFSEFCKDNTGGGKFGLSPSCRQCQSAYKKANRERARVRELTQKPLWNKKHPDLRRAYSQAASAKMRAREAGLTEHFTTAQWLALCVHYGNKCLRCGATEIVLTVDHIVPIRHGGKNTIDNIQPLCKACNTSKSDGSTDYRPKS